MQFCGIISLPRQNFPGRPLLGGICGYMRKIAVIFFMCTLIARIMAGGMVWAQVEPRSVAAMRTETLLVIDGKLDEASWQTADIATDFTDYKTDRYAIEQTFVRILYDDEYIYVGFECLEPEPNRIQATERKYDRPLMGDDWVGVQFDTFHDQRSYYSFMTNTLATRYDSRSGLFGGGGRGRARGGGFDASWSCEWKVACTMAKDRWFAEMAIPIGSMHFVRREGATWGANFQRGEKGRQEESRWSYFPSRLSAARHFGEITNLNLAETKVSMQPKVEYYVSNTNRFNDGTQEFSTGVDVSLRLSSQMISTFTINPDFGQVEADPDTIELLDIERFLEERRPFFREGNEIFNSPVNIYYSRRFADIEGGAKITGHGKNWVFGLLDIQGEVNRGEDLQKGNYLVSRFIHNIGENSHIGMIGTNSQREDGTNRVGGLDSRIYLNEDTSITAQILSMCDSEGIRTDDHTDHRAYALESALRGGTKPWSWSITYRDISRGFRPDLSFIERRNIRGPSTWINFRKDYPEGPVKNFGARSSFTLYENNEEVTTIRDFNESIELTLRNELEFQYAREDEFHYPYQNRAHKFEIGYNKVDRWNSVSGGYAQGVFQEEPYDEFSLDKPIKITDRLTTSIRGNYRLCHPDGGAEEIWLWRWVTEYSFSEKGRLKLTAEDTSEKRNNLTLLFSWPVRQNIDFYFLFNDYQTDGVNECGAFAKVVYRF